MSEITISEEELLKKKEELDKAIKFANKPAIHGIIDGKIKFKTELDEEVFGMLPLSPYQKEKLLIQMYDLKPLSIPTENKHEVMGD